MDITNNKAESELVELALKSLETTAARLDIFEKSEMDKSRLSAMMTDYYMLRIYLVRIIDMECNSVC